MAISTVNNTAGAATTSSQQNAAAAKAGANELGPADFMKLLVAQLKNQDPNNPLDTKELVTQLSQLTSVQQLVAIGDQMKSLTTATNGMAANQSAGLIGKSVQGTADSAQLDSTGSATSAVTLAENAAKATVTVTNAAGEVVRTFELPKPNAGPQAFTWDGKTTNGDRAAAGPYRFSIEAVSAAGKPVATDQSVSGIVSGVFYENGYPELEVGTTRVPLTNITSISQ